MIKTEQVEGITVLRLAHGKASALDLELLVGIAEEIDRFVASDARACVLTGTGGIFSAGVDLKRLVDGGDAYLEQFLPALDRAFRTLFFCPKPVVGACNGHAIAGGCVLLSACDVRIGVAGKGRIGVPELAVGVPFPLLALEIMRFATPPQHLQSLVYSGDVFGMEASLERGLVDQLVAASELDTAALQSARKLASYPAEAFELSKRLLRRPIAERLAATGDADAAEIRRSWGSEAVRGAVRAYVASTLR